MNKIAPLTLLFLSPFSSADYQAELQLSYVTSTQDTKGMVSGVDIESTIDSNKIDSRLTAYMDPVITADKPLAEAAFLNKTSNVSLHYSKNDSKNKNTFSFQPPPFTTESNFDIDSYGFGLNYITERRNWIIGAAAFKSSSEEKDAHIPNTNTAKRWSLHTGKYLTDSSSLQISYGQGSIKNDKYADLKTDSSDFGILYRHLFTLGNANHLGLNISASEIRHDGIVKNKDRGFTAGLNWYPIHALSVGGQYKIEKRSDSDANQATVMSQYFFTEAIAAHVTVTKTVTTFDNSNFNDADAMEYQLGAALRF